jgi:hypothetical protein
VIAVRARAAVAACVLVLAGGTAGCTTTTKIGPTSTVTVEAPTPSASTSTASASTASASPSPTRSRVLTRLPGTCDDLLPLGSVIDALGGRVPGKTVFVVGLPDRSIGRVGYINCQYGLATAAGNPAVEIQVSLYRTPAKAAARLQPTVDDYQQHGARATPTTVAGKPATVLTGGAGAGYGPTIVLVDGQRTVVVSLRPDAFASGRVAPGLTALAGLAARRTG